MRRTSPQATKNRRRRLLFVAVFALVVVAGLPVPSRAIDPPHPANCNNCHLTHDAPGAAITGVAGNANLCLSCHSTAQVSPENQLFDSDQALPAPGLSTGASGSGDSHRWDSGPPGHVAADAGNTSTGVVTSGGAFTGAFAKAYTVTITAGGDAGAATFSWSCNRWEGDTPAACGSGAGVSGTDVALGGEGLTLTFGDGTSPSFVTGDFWTVYVRPDVAQPTAAEMAARLEQGKLMCSTCHDEHSQSMTPFDPNAPAFGGAGTGDGRHFQRLDNDLNQMCLDCHNARDVGSLSALPPGSNLSHPVGVPVPGTGDYQAPSQLPLDSANDVVCLTCHYVHAPTGAATNDGTLTRLADNLALCTDCHTLADTATPASHLSATSGALWPGGQYGTTFPAITDAGERGSCTNCHQPHGWPDTATPTQDYDTLLVEAAGDVCFTCHDGAPVSPDIYTQFNPSPVYTDTSDSGAAIDQVHDPAICASCHDPHVLTSNNRLSDPNSPTGLYTETYNTANAYQGQDYRNVVTDFDPVNPVGAPVGGNGDVGPASANGANTGNDSAASNEGPNYTGPEDQTYTVEVTTGGQPPAAQITVTSTGADSSGPTTVTAFGTPIAVGNFGATITFTEGGGTPGTVGPAVAGSNAGDDSAASNEGPNYTGSVDLTYTVTISNGGVPGGETYSVGAATCTDVTNSPPCLDDAAVAGGTYDDQGDPGNISYFVAVTTSGSNNNAEITVTSTGNRDDSGPTTWSDGATLPVGTRGVTIAITDGQGGRSLDTGESWQIDVTQTSAGAQITVTSTGGVDDSGPTDVSAFGTPIPVGTLGVTISFTDGGDGVLTLNDAWTIDATAGLPGDGLTLGDRWDIPVTLSTNCIPNCVEPDFVAFCLTCHDGDPPPDIAPLLDPQMLDIATAYFGSDQHGSDVGETGTSVSNGYKKVPWGTQADNDAGRNPAENYAAMQCTTCHDGHGSPNLYHLRTSIEVGGVQMQVGGKPGSEFDFLTPSTSYELPLSGGVQVDHLWGAWCSFCHELSSHPGVGESTTCQGGHMHDGGNF